MPEKPDVARHCMVSEVEDSRRFRGQPASFDFRNPDWEGWISRYEQYRVSRFLNTMPEAYQVNLLLYTMGEKGDDLLASLNISNEESFDCDEAVERFASSSSTFDYCSLGFLFKLDDWSSSKHGLLVHPCLESPLPLEK